MGPGRYEHGLFLRGVEPGAEDDRGPGAQLPELGDQPGYRRGRCADQRQVRNAG